MALARAAVVVGLVGVVGGASRAHADDELSSKRHEVGIGVAMGWLGAGGAEVTTSGVSFSYGRRSGRWLLLGEWNPLLATYTIDPDADVPQEEAGMLQRVNLLARYSYARFRPISDLGFDLWAEAGVAREWLAWEDGGALVRNAAVFSLGGEEVVRLGKGSSKYSVMRVFVHVRWMVTPALAARGQASMARCVGECGGDSDAGGYDVGLQMITGLSWAW